MDSCRPNISDAFFLLKVDEIDEETLNHLPKEMQYDILVNIER